MGNKNSLNGLRSFGITKNPYDTGYYAGGSSSGCASATACGWKISVN